MRRRNHFAPFVCYDAMGYIRQDRVVAEQNGEALRCVCWETSKMHVFSSEIATGMVGLVGTRYIKSENDPVAAATVLKTKALAHGATPEAVRLIGLVVALTKQEEATMAKPATKLAPKGADKTTLAAAAKAAPVGGKAAAAAAPRPRGNPAALAAAREAKMVNRKYKALVKAKDLTLRDESWTKHMVETILGNKDTDSARAAHKESGEFEGKSLDFTWAAKKEYIAF